MRGTVLGFKDDRGVLQTERGRVHFGLNDWMEEAPPARGQLVDFEEVDGKASEIFLALEDELVPASVNPTKRKRSRPVQPVMPSAEEIGDNVSQRINALEERDDALGQFVYRIRSAPEMALAFLLLIAALFLPYASLGYDDAFLQELGIAGLEAEVTLVGVPSEIESMNSALDTLRDRAAEQLDQADTLEDASVGRQAEFLEAKRKLERIVGAIDKLQRLHSFAVAAWIVPALALVVMALAWVGYGWSRPVAIVLGVASCASAYFLTMWEKQYIALIVAQLETGDTLSTVRRAAQKAFELEWGGWLLALLGVGAIVFGLLNRSGAQDDDWNEDYE